MSESTVPVNLMSPEEAFGLSFSSTGDGLTQYRIAPPPPPFLVAPDLCPVKFCLAPGARMPERAHLTDAGFDVFVLDGCAATFEPGERGVMRTGVRMALEPGWECQVRPRSGRALKEGLSVLNSPGTIDSAYLGEVGVLVINHGDKDIVIYPGDKVAQLVFSRVPTVLAEVVSEADFEKLTTDRGVNGFGSTGTK